MRTNGPVLRANEMLATVVRDQAPGDGSGVLGSITVTDGEARPLDRGGPAFEQGQSPVDRQVFSLRVQVIHGSEGTAVLQLLY